MANIIDTPLRLFVELTPQGVIAGRYQLEFQRRVEVDGAEVVPAVVNVRDLSPDEGAAVLANDAAGLAAKVQALSQELAEQTGALRKQLADQDEASTRQLLQERATAKAILDERIAQLERVKIIADQALKVIASLQEADRTWSSALAGPMAALEKALAEPGPAQPMAAEA